MTEDKNRHWINEMDIVEHLPKDLSDIEKVLFKSLFPNLL